MKRFFALFLLLITIAIWAKADSSVLVGQWRRMQVGQSCDIYKFTADGKCSSWEEIANRETGAITKYERFSDYSYTFNEEALTITISEGDFLQVLILDYITDQKFLIQDGSYIDFYKEDEGKYKRFCVSNDFGVDIYYRPLSDTECAVVRRPDSYYQGEFEIPATVSFGNQEYSVVAIADSAFWGGELDHVRIPSTVQKIGSYAFYDCSILYVLVLDAETPPVCGENAFADYRKKNVKLAIPEGSFPAYCDIPAWQGFMDILFLNTSKDIDKDIILGTWGNGIGGTYETAMTTYLEGNVYHNWTRVDTPYSEGYEDHPVSHDWYMFNPETLVITSLFDGTYYSTRLLTISDECYITIQGITVNKFNHIVLPDFVGIETISLDKAPTYPCHDLFGMPTNGKQGLYIENGKVKLKK